MVGVRLLIKKGVFMEFKKSLLMLTCVFAVAQVFADASVDEADVKGTKKCLNVRNLNVCNLATINTLAVTGNETVGGTLAVSGNESVGGALIVSGNETVGGNLAVSGNEAVSGSFEVSGDAVVGGTLAVAGLLSLTSPNVLDYGSFYTDAAGALATGIDLSTGVSTSSYTALSGGTGTGVTVADAGTYLVWYSVYGANNTSAWQLEVNATPVPGSGATNSTSSTVQYSHGNGFAVVTAAAGQNITIVGSNAVLATAPGNSVLFSILRVR